MHYQWIERDLLSNEAVPCDYLEIREHNIPGLLRLAKEARELVGVNAPSGFLDDIQFPAVRVGNHEI